MTSATCLVLFGASGDLARKKLIPALYRLEERGALDQSIVGVALDSWTDDDFCGHVVSALASEVPNPDRKVEAALLDRLSYVSGDYNDKQTFQKLATSVAQGAALMYLAIPPDLFSTVVSGLDAVGLTSQSRLLIEKPFGRDLQSAKKLNALLHGYLDESQVFRIDHFLGKEPVENLLVFRYANPIFDDVWNGDCIDHIQITMAESFGVEDRGALYDTLGVVRDVVQNHLLQVLCLLTMEAPDAPTADAFAKSRLDILKAVQTIGHKDVVFGQYEGYQSIPHVADNSMVPTYAALSLRIDSPRWRDVPIYMRAGKSMAVTATEAVVVFRRPQPLTFSPSHPLPKPSELVFRVGPRDGVDLRVQTRTPGQGLRLATTPLTLDYDRLFGRIPLAYEHVLEDALVGDRTHFSPEEGVEEAWRIVQRILEPSAAPISYARGSWGPEPSQAILHGARNWIDPLT